MAVSGTLFVVATPIGNLEDITMRALRVLGEVSLIAAEDTRRTAQLLARYAITTPTTSLHEHNESKKSAVLVDRLRRGESIALVSDAGTPTVSDPGERLIAAAIEAGIRIEPVPGASAVLAALAASGLPTATFTFLGFPPTRAKDRTDWFKALGSVAGTAVFFEAPHRIEKTLRQLEALIGNRPVCVARELTKIHEELVRGPINEVLGRLSSRRGEFTIVVELGYSTESTSPRLPIGRELLLELGRLIEIGGASKRQALASLAKKYGRPVNELYDAVERTRKSG